MAIRRTTELCASLRLANPCTYCAIQRGVRHSQRSTFTGDMRARSTISVISRNRESTFFQVNHKKTGRAFFYAGDCTYPTKTVGWDGLAKITSKHSHQSSTKIRTSSGLRYDQIYYFEHSA